jgi:membrane protein HdeD
MAEGKNILLGILAIIIGLIVIAFPLLGVKVLSYIAGLSILFLGIWMLIMSWESWDASKGASIAMLIFGILGIVVGLSLFGNIILASFLASWWFYFAGFFMIIAGIFGIFGTGDTADSGLGILGVVLGIIYIILGAYAWNPLYLGFLIGIWFIITGISQFFVMPSAAE